MMFPRPLRRRKVRRRGIDPRVALDTYARDDNLCQWCRRPGGQLVPHHRLRRSQGGQDNVHTLVSVHPTCHAYIHDHPDAAADRRFLVRSVLELGDPWH